MKALIYTRVMPDNERVIIDDCHQAQERRCREFAEAIHISIQGVYSDQGAMHPPQFLPGINKLLVCLAHREEKTLVIADHPERLGSRPYILDMLRWYIGESGGYFISAHRAVDEAIDLIDRWRVLKI